MILQSFNEFRGLDNLYTAWRHFRRGKPERRDVILFERNLEHELFKLSEDLLSGSYVHGSYADFCMRDPKFRQIHKATVRDRVVHQALFDVLYPQFERRFYFDSYSSRKKKGTYAAISRVSDFLRKESHNGRREAWALHGDVKNFFASVDHRTLANQLRCTISDDNYFRLCKKIVFGFNSQLGKGLPLGNLTSQLFANVYLHELDYFVKQALGIKRYARYNDDFFIVSADKRWLMKIGYVLQKFLQDQLFLSLPEDKIQIRRLADGIDILGVVAFLYGLVPRRRLESAAHKCLEEAAEFGYTLESWRKTVSYIGLLKHTKKYFLRERLRLCYAQP